MKHPLFSVLFFIISIGLYSQQTERLLVLVANFEKIESKPYTTCYKNGALKRKGEKTIYKYKDEYFVVETGKSIGYFKNGAISNIRIQDEHGNYLNNKFFDRSGNFKEEWIAIEIDATEKSVEEYIESYGAGDFKRLFKYYRYSKKLGKRYVYKEVYWTIIDNVKGGTRKYFDIYGTVKRTKIINPNGK